MPTLKPGTILPTPEEDKEIRKAVATDPDAKLLEDPNIKLVSFSELKKKKKWDAPQRQILKSIYACALISLKKQIYPQYYDVN
ncbi:BrnA antitoxin family protein [Yersinia enterocolitica]